MQNQTAADGALSLELVFPEEDWVFPENAVYFEWTVYDDAPADITDNAVSLSLDGKSVLASVTNVNPGKWKIIHESGTEDGTHTVQIRVADANGNAVSMETSFASYNFITDRTAENAERVIALSEKANNGTLRSSDDVYSESGSVFYSGPEETDAAFFFRDGCLMLSGTEPPGVSFRLSDGDLIADVTDERYELFSTDMKGAYNASDLNRIGQSVNMLSRLLTRHGYGDGEIAAKHDWIGPPGFDTPTDAQLSEFLENVRTLRGYIPDSLAKLLKDYMRDIPQSAANLGYEGANNIEEVLELTVDAARYIVNSAASANWYSGEPYGGET